MLGKVENREFQFTPGCLESPYLDHIPAKEYILRPKSMMHPGQQIQFNKKTTSDTGPVTPFTAKRTSPADPRD